MKYSLKTKRCTVCNAFTRCTFSLLDQVAYFENYHIYWTFHLEIFVLVNGVFLYLSSPSPSSSVFCRKAGPSLQAEKPRLQFCRRQVFHCKLRNQGCSFTRDLICAVASRCFPHPPVSLTSEQSLKDL